MRRAAAVPLRAQPVRTQPGRCTGSGRYRGVRRQSLECCKTELGERLFADVRLSASGDLSCASCHDPGRYFTEPRARSLSATGEPLAFNAPSLLNVAYAASFGWAAPGVSTLEAAVRRPLAASNELATNPAALESLWGDAEIQRLVRRADRVRRR